MAYPQLIHTDTIKQVLHLQSSPSVNIYGLQLLLEDAVPRPLSKQLPLQVEQLPPPTQQPSGISHNPHIQHLLSQLIY